MLSLLAGTLAPLPALADSMRLVEAQVIAAYLNSLNLGKPQVKVLVIESRTAVLDEAFVAIEPNGKQLASGLPSATAAVIADFLQVAKTDAEIDVPKRLVRSDLEWLVVPRATLDRIFGVKEESRGDIWGRFYKEYPRAAGIMRISRVGIDEKANQALFYFSATPGGLGGAGYFVLMQRLSGAWKVVASDLAWRS